MVGLNGSFLNFFVTSCTTNFTFLYTNVGNLRRNFKRAQGHSFFVRDSIPPFTFWGFGVQLCATRGRVFTVDDSDPTDNDTGAEWVVITAPHFVGASLDNLI